MDRANRDGPALDVGRLLYAVRPTPGPLATAVMIGFLGSIALLIYLTNDHSLLYTSAGIVGGGAVMAPVALVGLLEQHRIHEHAVVVGLTWPHNRPYVIPVSTIDATTVTVHRRANLMSRRLKSNGLPTMRMAVYSTCAVSFVGLTYEQAHPRLNPAEMAGYQVIHAAVSGTLMPRGDRSLWALGVRRPQRLLEALEAAFAADGRPAPGLAAEAAAHPVVEPSGRPYLKG